MRWPSTTSSTAWAWRRRSPALFALLAGAGLSHLVRLAPRTIDLTSGLLALAFAIHLQFSLVLEGRVQHDVEDQVRMLMGKRLGPGRNNMFELIAAAHPDWVVLRP